MIDSLMLSMMTLAQQGPVVPGAPGGGNGTPLPDPAGGAATRGGGGFDLMFIVLMMLVVLVLFTMMGGRRQRKERAKLLSSLKRNDRVQTVGGVIGTVIELTDNEMVLRVDETSNTRIRFARSAVQQILREGKDEPRLDAKIQPAS